MKKIPIITFLILMLAIAPVVFAEDKIEVFFFYGDGCPHCADEKPYLQEMEQMYPELEVNYLEVWYNEANTDFFRSKMAEFDMKPTGVPTTIIDDKVWIGFSDSTKREITEKIAFCSETGCGIELPPNNNTNEKIVELPIFGSVDVSKVGLFGFTVMIGTLDGFNACAMWVLTFLLSILVYSGSRKRIFLIGGTFIFVSGLVYFLFMAAWMNAFIFAGHLKFLQIAISLLAIVFGLINIKDYFFFGKGISLMIPEDKKPKIIKKMKSLLKPGPGIILTLIGVASLAFMVNMIELLCTAGFPAVYTKILTGYDLPAIGYYLYLLLYIVMYMIDDFIIFSIVVMTMSSKRFTEKYGRISKLISGLIILILGLLMLINPQILMFG